jgi:hypothetical protein
MGIPAGGRHCFLLPPVWGIKDKNIMLTTETLKFGEDYKKREGRR